MGRLDSEVKAVWRAYERGLRFNERLNLYDTVAANENFFIGKQWEGVKTNGLPTPVFNFLKRATLFTVSSITSDNLRLNAAPMQEGLDEVAAAVNREFGRLFEYNNIGGLLREFLRNAAVDGDGCTFTYWDAEAAAIRTEVLENTRVFFGDPNDRRVQTQPFLLISSRETPESVRARAREGDREKIRPDDAPHARDGLDERVTVLLKLWRDRESGTIHACECTRDCLVRPEWDLGIRLYPLTWLNWDYVQDCYHGMAMVTGLIPNQIFVNKAWSMIMLSLMTTAYPRIVYDRTRVARWDNRVGAAIGVNGDVSGVAKILDPAQLSPQVGQLISMAVDMTQSLLGATAAALGDVRPDNTSAIIALQRASAVPSEITRQNLHQSVEDLGRIYLEFMAEYYGKRQGFDFSLLKTRPLHLKLDVGASSYWSEIASVQTLDNLLTRGKIDIVDYLERLPDGYVAKKQALIDKLRGRTQAPEEVL